MRYIPSLLRLKPYSRGAQSLSWRSTIIQIPHHLDQQALIHHVPVPVPRSVYVFVLLLRCIIDVLPVYDAIIQKSNGELKQRRSEGFTSKEHLRAPFCLCLALMISLLPGLRESSAI
ncbi:hypothetical protein SRHO_G00220710 [Serrasalmus rhombeus]